MFIPVSLAKSCGFITYASHLEEILKYDEFYLLKGWSAKFARCDETFKADAFICEKTSDIKEKVCFGKHHECDDGTSILSIYLCDTVLTGQMKIAAILK